MSNFSAPTRKKGSNDEYKDAIWVDNYFGPKKYGVRFRGTIEFERYELELEEMEHSNNKSDETLQRLAKESADIENIEKLMEKEQEK